MAFQFPNGFLWGAGTSAHQIEGGNWNSDWWEFEHIHGAPITEPSGDACDHYHRYAEDISLMEELGLNAFRFGIEWARIEPEEGEFSLAALNHYQAVCETCRAHGIKPVITFNHCSLPRWVAHQGGYVWEAFPDHFAKYCERAASFLKAHLGYVVTLNEPELTANLGMRYGNFPRLGMTNLDNYQAAEQCLKVLRKAHQYARDAIKTAAPDARVGLSLAFQEWGGFEGSEEELQRHPLVNGWEGKFYEATRGDDFVGIQTYTRLYLPPESGDKTQGEGSVKTYQGLEGYFSYPEGTRRTPLGYEYRPQAVGATIRRTYNLTKIPILVTENGVASDDDGERVEYITGALNSIQSCMEEGLPVKGYLHWSLLDNFEWNQGYKMKFGLVAVDRQTFARTVKPSARFLGAIARKNAI